MSNNNQHIPSGYKLSPLGIIPEDWEVKRLGEVCNFLRNNTLSRKQLNDTNGKVQNIHYGDILVNYPSILNACTESIPYVNQEDYKDTLTDFIEDGDVIMADTAEDETVGKACEITNVDSKQILAGLHTMLFRPQKGLFASSFLGYHINSNSYRKQLNTLMQGIKVCSLGKQVIANTFLLLPPLHEQKRICDLLSLWDTAIAKQTALIEKLTLRKRGLMQQLLTGKKRLKGFEGKWKEARLGDCGKFLINNTLSRERLNERSGSVQNIHYGDVLIKYPSILDCDKVKLPFINETAYKDSMADFVKNGDIVIADTAEDETVGKACEVQNIGTNKILAGLHTMLFRPNEGLFSPFFLGYYINSEIYHSKLIPLIQGIKVCSIGKQPIKNTIVIIPNINEQKAIASVLVNADKEIEIQKQKLAAMQEQKKGLMQVLLTGKKRIEIC